MKRHPAARLFAVLILAGCSATRPPDDGGALYATWSGADTGSFRSVATARWCPGPRFGELLGMRGDTGIAIAIRQVDSLVPGRYPAVLPDSADTAASATVGLRFLGRTSVSGYQSDSGWVTLERDARNRVGVQFDVKAGAVGGGARIRLHGRATGVPLARDGEECTTPWRPSE